MMRTKVQAFALWATKFGSGLLAFVAGTLWSAFCLELTWNWHVTTIGMPFVSFWQAAGLAIVLPMFTGSATVLLSMAKDSDESLEFGQWMVDRFYYALGLGLLTLMAWAFMLLREMT